MSATLNNDSAYALTQVDSTPIYELGYVRTYNDGTHGERYFKYVYNPSTSAIAQYRTVQQATAQTGTNQYYAELSDGTPYSKPFGVTLLGSLPGTKYGWMLTNGRVGSAEVGGVLFGTAFGTPGTGTRYLIAGTTGTFGTAAVVIGTTGSLVPEMAIGRSLTGGTLIEIAL